MHAMMLEDKIPTVAPFFGIISVVLFALAYSGVMD